MRLKLCSKLPSSSPSRPSRRLVSSPDLINCPGARKPSRKRWKQQLKPLRHKQPENNLKPRSRRQKHCRKRPSKRCKRCKVVSSQASSRVSSRASSRARKDSHLRSPDRSPRRAFGRLRETRVCHLNWPNWESVPRIGKSSRRSCALMLVALELEACRRITGDS